MNSPASTHLGDSSSAQPRAKRSLPPILIDMRAKARVVLKIERLWNAFRLPLALLGLWGVLSLFRIPQRLPDVLHGLLEGGLIFFVAHRAYRYVQSASPITERQTDQKLEADSNLAHQPLSALADRPAENGPSSRHQREIWSLHRARVLAGLDGLRVRGPRLFPTLRSRLEAGGFLALAVGALVFAGPHVMSRLHAGLLPGTDDDAVPLPHFQAWIDQPGWASGAPVFLTAGETKLPPIAQGAQLHVIVSGSKGAPVLHGVTPLSLHALSKTSWEETASLTHSATITLYERGRLLARWPVKIVPDVAPKTAWTGKPGPQKNGWRTVFPGEAAQETGLKSVSVILTWPVGSPHPTRILHVALPLQGHPRSTKQTTELDLSENILAGLTVEGRIEAKSLSGLTGLSAPATFKLGSRQFSDPLARGLLFLRQRLALGEETPREAERDLDLLAALPLPDSLRVPLGVLVPRLDSARRDEKKLAGVLADLWFLALYAEDYTTLGPQVAALMAQLRAAQREAQLQIEAMKDRHPVPLKMQTSLHKALDEMKTALDRRMSLMMRQASQTGLVMPMPQGKNAPWNKLGSTIQTEALDNRTSAALEHLAELAEMAEQMRQAGAPDLQALSRQMKGQAEVRAQRAALQDLIKRETTLLDHAQVRLGVIDRKAAAKQPKDITQMSTSDLLRQLGITPPPGMERPSPAPTLDLDTLRQQADGRQKDHAVQRALQTLDRILQARGKELTGKKTESLAKADHDMEAALTALAQRDDTQAAAAEEKVLKDLAQARSEMRRNQKAAQGKNHGRLGFIPPPGQANSDSDGQGNSNAEQEPAEDGQDMDDDNDTPEQTNRDPLGRKLDDSPESDAHIPDHPDSRARAIEKELRKRASDRTRSQGELDYLNRLLAPYRQTPTP